MAGTRRLAGNALRRATAAAPVKRTSSDLTRVFTTRSKRKREAHKASPAGHHAQTRLERQLHYQSDGAVTAAE